MNIGVRGRSVGPTVAAAVQHLQPLPRSCPLLQAHTSAAAAVLVYSTPPSSSAVRILVAVLVRPPICRIILYCGRIARRRAPHASRRAHTRARRSADRSVYEMNLGAGRAPQRYVGRAIVPPRSAMLSPKPWARAKGPAACAVHCYCFWPGEQRMSGMSGAIPLLKASQVALWMRPVLAAERWISSGKLAQIAGCFFDACRA
jgi:hypothetical protein